MNLAGSLPDDVLARVGPDNAAGPSGGAYYRQRTIRAWHEKSDRVMTASGQFC